MANLLQQYGIKEVADVQFYDLETKKLVLYLDTLKVSTIEQTAEQAEARGGKGNPPLIIWDYGKEITLNIEDALYSPQSMALMFGSKPDDVKVTQGENVLITKVQKYVVPEDNYSGVSISSALNLPTGASIISYYVQGDNANKLTDSSTPPTKLSKGEVVYVQYTIPGKGQTQIEINANTFPGTYRIIGDTYARNASTGVATYYQFEIPKAKMNAEQTITLEAEGDPTVFNMSLRVLRGDDGAMMKLRQYDASINGGDASVMQLSDSDNPGGLG